MKYWICLFSAVFVPVVAFAIDGTQLLETVDRKLEPLANQAYRKLVDIQPDGSKRESVVFTMKKGPDAVIALFLAPAGDKGRVTLRQGDNLWLYTPDVGRTIRFTGLQAGTGIVFNSADLVRIDYSAEYDVVSVDERSDVYLLTMKAKAGKLAYDRLTMRVDKASMLPLVIEGFSADGVLLKTIRFTDVRDFGGGIRRPATIETESPLFAGYKSVMTWLSIAAREAPDEVFTINNLPRVQEQRQ